jgi:hypothetical protein
MTATTTDTNPQELAHRAGDGIDVQLLWVPATGVLLVRVADERLEDGFQLTVDAAHALDAFEHPYAYAAFRQVSYRTAGRRETVFA